jgi:hypothetical protein
MADRAPSVPAGLGNGGRKLWRDVLGLHPELDATQLVQLHEACRAKDRCDQLDRLLRGDADMWLAVAGDGEDRPAKIVVDQALSKANETANLMKQLLAAMRLPDQVSGKRPQQRGGSRGTYTASGKAGKVSSLEQARRRATGV